MGVTKPGMRILDSHILRKLEGGAKVGESRGRGHLQSSVQVEVLEIIRVQSRERGVLGCSITDGLYVDRIHGGRLEKRRRASGTVSCETN